MDASEICRPEPRPARGSATASRSSSAASTAARQAPVPPSLANRSLTTVEDACATRKPPAAAVTVTPGDDSPTEAARQRTRDQLGHPGQGRRPDRRSSETDDLADFNFICDAPARARGRSRSREPARRLLRRQGRTPANDRALPRWTRACGGRRTARRMTAMPCATGCRRAATRPRTTSCSPSPSWTAMKDVEVRDTRPLRPHRAQGDVLSGDRTRRDGSDGTVAGGEQEAAQQEGCGRQCGRRGHRLAQARPVMPLAWLAGVTGSPENTLRREPPDPPAYAGHGTFIAGVIRAIAPACNVHVLSFARWTRRSPGAAYASPSWSTPDGPRATTPRSRPT